MVIALGCLDSLGYPVNLWLEVGIMSNNTQRCIHVNDIHESLGPLLCTSLPFLHALTGSNYTSSFSKKGKIQPFKILESDKEMQHVFTRFKDVDHTDFRMVEKFVCKLYGKHRCISVNDLRVHSFCQKYKPKGNNLITGVKKIDASFLPPCESVMREKVKQCFYVTRSWFSSTNRHPPSYLQLIMVGS